MPGSHLDSLVPTRPFDRRDFLQTTVGAGFAAAVLPVTAQTITTDTAGLSAGAVTIPVGDFKMPAYRAAPAGQSRPPVILVVSEVFGVHEYIADVARRLAKQGYFAVAPELFARQGDAKSYTDISRLLSEVVNKVPDEQVMGDLDACVAWADAQGADTSKLGITGFCWGGRHVWLFDAHNAKVKAAVAWYGSLMGERTPLKPRHPIDVVAQLHGPVLGLYGGKDPGNPMSAIEQMKQALQADGQAARESQFVVYPDAPHAFHADYRPSYTEDAAEDGWKRCVAWFKSHGAA
jgi:carboxymethylenebutenolidase